MRRSTVIAASLGALLAGTAGAVWATTFTLSAKHLGATSLVTPSFFPTSLTTTNVGTIVGRAQQNDKLTVVYSEEVLASTICSGASTTVGTQTLTGATVTIGNNTGSTGNDVLTLSVPTSTCPGGIHFGSVDLGSASYVSGANVVFSNSTLALTQTTSSGTLVITLGTASGGTTATVSSGSAQVYTPDPAITNTAGGAIGTNLAKSSATIAF